MSADQASSSARAPYVPGPKVVRYHRFVALLYVGAGLTAMGILVVVTQGLSASSLAVSGFLLGPGAVMVVAGGWGALRSRSAAAAEERELPPERRRVPVGGEPVENASGPPVACSSPWGRAWSWSR